MTDSELTIWEHSDSVMRVLTSKEMGAWLYRRDKRVLVTELEKIKTEIIKSCNNIAQEVSDLSYTRKIYVYEQLSEIKGAIDNRISELKGD